MVSKTTLIHRNLRYCVKCSFKKRDFAGFKSLNTQHIIELCAKTRQKFKLKKKTIIFLTFTGAIKK